MALGLKSRDAVAICEYFFFLGGGGGGGLGAFMNHPVIHALSCPSLNGIAVAMMLPTRVLFILLTLSFIRNRSSLSCVLPLVQTASTPPSG